MAEEELKGALAAHAHALVTAEYAAIGGCMGTGSDFPLPAGGSRPWLAEGGAIRGVPVSGMM